MTIHFHQGRRMRRMAWDEVKDAIHRRKHRVSFPEASDAFFDLAAGGGTRRSASGECDAVLQLGRDWCATVAGYGAEGRG
jgi:uncharacterized DUF497 family protein